MMLLMLLVSLIQQVKCLSGLISLVITGTQFKYQTLIVQILEHTL